MPIATRHRFKAAASHGTKRYHELKARGICVCCGRKRAVSRLVEDHAGNIVERRPMVKCWPCTLDFRAYQKSRS